MIKIEYTQSKHWLPICFFMLRMVMGLQIQAQNREGENNNPRWVSMLGVRHYQYSNTWNNLSREQFRSRIEEMRRFGWLVSYHFDFNGHEGTLQAGANEVSGERVRPEERQRQVLNPYVVGPPDPSRRRSSRRTSRTRSTDLLNVGNRVQFRMEGADPSGMITVLINTNHGGQNHADILTINLGQAHHADNDPYQLGLFFGEFLYQQLNHHQATQLTANERNHLRLQAWQFGRWMNRQRTTTVPLQTGNAQALFRGRPRQVPLIQHPLWEDHNGSLAMNRFLSGVAAQYLSLATSQGRTPRNYRLTRRTMHGILVSYIQRGRTHFFDRVGGRRSDPNFVGPVFQPPIDRDGLEPPNSDGGKEGATTLQNTRGIGEAIYDMQGKVIESSAMTGGSLNVNGTDLSPGLYIMRKHDKVKKVCIAR